MFNKITQGNEKLLSGEIDPDHFEEKIRKLFDEWGVKHRLDLTELDISDIRKLIEVLDVKNTSASGLAWRPGGRFATAGKGFSNRFTGPLHELPSRGHPPSAR